MEVKSIMKSRMILTAAAAAVCVAGYAYAGCGSCGKGESASACERKAACEHKAADVPKVDTAGLKELLAKGEAVTVLDARSGKWDDGNRIAGAKALNAETPDEEVTKALPDKDAKIVTYCGGLKCPASSALADKLTKLGYKNVTEYPEGIEGWVKDGNEVKKAN
jgi:rhodanese-related sulfurtransferase